MGKVQNTAELKAEIVRSHAHIQKNEDYATKVIRREWIKRLHAVIAADGGHIETS